MTRAASAAALIAAIAGAAAQRATECPYCGGEPWCPGAAKCGAELDQPEEKP